MHRGTKIQAKTSRRVPAFVQRSTLKNIGSFRGKVVLQNSLQSMFNSPLPQTSVYKIIIKRRGEGGESYHRGQVKSEVSSILMILLNIRGKVSMHGYYVQCSYIYRRRSNTGSASAATFAHCTILSAARCVTWLVKWIRMTKRMRLNLGRSRKLRAATNRTRTAHMLRHCISSVNETLQQRFP